MDVCEGTWRDIEYKSYGPGECKTQEKTRGNAPSLSHRWWATTTYLWEDEVRVGGRVAVEPVLPLQRLLSRRGEATHRGAAGIDVRTQDAFNPRRVGPPQQWIASVAMDLEDGSAVR